MNVMIDTHVLLWLMFDADKLNENELMILRDPIHDVYVSSISLFEISLKYSLDKIELEGIEPDQIPQILLSSGYQIEEALHESLASIHKLPYGPHKDPFDRMIIHEALQKNYSLLSRDNKFKHYREFGLKLL